MIYVVLGMHKSGTTLVAQLLHEAGIDMGNFDPGVGYDKGNHYERREANRINKLLLACGSAWSPQVVKTVMPDQVPPEAAFDARQMIEQLGSAHPDWGFKDPRTTLTYRWWRERLGAHKVIVVFRHPYEVWRHYQRRPVSEYMNRLWTIKLAPLRAWQVYNLEALAAVSNLEEDSVILLDYGELMESNVELERLGRFVGKELRDIRKPSQYRSRGQTSFTYRISDRIARYAYDVENSLVLEELREARSAQMQRVDSVSSC